MMNPQGEYPQLQGKGGVMFRLGHEFINRENYKKLKNLIFLCNSYLNYIIKVSHPKLIEWHKISKNSYEY